MTSELELAVILTTYQRPQHLERSLISLSLQQGVSGKFEVIVADDGSTDSTERIVHEFARRADFPVRWISHPHDGFRVALCRNDGARASTAPYLLFTDGDCLFPADHLQKHLHARKPGVVRAGDCLRLGEKATDRVDAVAIESGAYRKWAFAVDRRRLIQKRFKERCYELMRHRFRPKLTGWNIGIARHDFEVVNGFDESFVGWGCEDDDLAFRLRKAGRRIASALPYTHGYHMWHPTAPSCPARWSDGPNVERLQTMDRPVRCAFGLLHDVEELEGDASADVEVVSFRVPRQSKCAV
jgi:glycosyltransferase involved in cell wall biosynthesis